MLEICVRPQLSPFSLHAHLDMQMQYSFDYCQQVSLPHSSQQRGTFYFRTPRKVLVFGVCCECLSSVVHTINKIHDTALKNNARKIKILKTSFSPLFMCHL